MPKLKKCYFFFHDWKTLPVNKGLRMRCVISRRFCPKCGTHQVKKYWNFRWTTTGDTSTIKRCMEELENIIENYYNKYVAETMFMSFTVRNNENYKKIIESGTDVLPFLFSKLQEAPNFNLLSMICDISKADISIPEKMRGKLKPITEIYLQWGKENAYIKD